MANRNGKNTIPSSSSSTAEIPVEVTVERYLADIAEGGDNYNCTLLYCPTTGKGMNVPNPPRSPIRQRLVSGVISTARAGTGTPESSQRKHYLNELHTCHVCSMQFATLNGLQWHIRSHPAMEISGGGVRAPPAFEGRGKAVQSDEVPRNTAASEMIDLTVGDDDINGPPLANCKISIDLNKPPPRDEDEDEDEDEDDGLGDISPGLVA